MMTKKTVGVLAALAVGAFVAPAFGSERVTAPGGESSAPVARREARVKDAEAAVVAFRSADPGLSRFFDGAVGYAVFPSVGKGALGIGGAYGRGVVFRRGDPVGDTTLTQVTIGAQLGGQTYSEVVFFETERALARFEKGELAMAGEVSAVVAASGTSANARYAQGVAVFTLPKSGLMAEASVGGQKFRFTPFTKATM